jgi:hypothetical protein
MKRSKGGMSKVVGGGRTIKELASMWKEGIVMLERSIDPLGNI